MNDPARADLYRHVDRLLREAGAYHRFPTPIDAIVAAAGLRDADDYVLDDSLVRQLPLAMQTLLRSVKRKVQGLVNHRELVIHFDPGVQNQHKRGFIRLHETTHHLLPRQRDLLYADDHETLFVRVGDGVVVEIGYQLGLVSHLAVRLLGLLLSAVGVQPLLRRDPLVVVEVDAPVLQCCAGAVRGVPRHGRGHRIILTDGWDLALILDGHLACDDALRLKLEAASVRGEPYQQLSEL